MVGNPEVICPGSGLVLGSRLAFNLYESPGRQDGHDVEDWLRAEEELGRYA